LLKATLKGCLTKDIMRLYQIYYSMGVLRISMVEGGCSAALKKITPRITSATAPAIIPTGNKKTVVKQIPQTIWV
jgi:hypothetical protein